MQRFTLATIPSYLPYEKNMRVSVSIDGAEPVICQMKEDYNSKEWKMNHWRGQALKSFYVTLLDGYHTVKSRRWMTISSLTSGCLISM